jgi:hypothetical protein
MSSCYARRSDVSSLVPKVNLVMGIVLLHKVNVQDPLSCETGS